MAELRHWNAFLATARDSSISAASDRLSLSQPALSKQIAELERDLGVRLFERRSRGVALTEAGKLLLPYARRIGFAAADAEREALDIRGLRTGRIVIGASTTIADYLLAPAVSLFVSRHPGVSLSVRVGNTADIARQVREEQCEIGLVEGPIDEENLDIRAFFEDELLFFVAPGHPLASRGQMSFREVLAYGVVLREQGSGTRAVFERAVRAHEFNFTEIATLGSNEAVKRAVRLGVGFGVVSRLALADELEAGHLVQIHVHDVRLQRPLNRLIRAGRGVSRTFRALIAALDNSLIQDPEFHGLGMPAVAESDWDPTI